MFGNSDTNICQASFKSEKQTPTFRVTVTSIFTALQFLSKLIKKKRRLLAKFNDAPKIESDLIISKAISLPTWNLP